MENHHRIQSSNFFRKKLETLDSSEIPEYIESFYNQQDELEKEIALICFHYHNITWFEAWSLSYKERLTVVDQFKKIKDAEREASGKGKIIRGSDVENRKYRPGKNKPDKSVYS